MLTKELIDEWQGHDVTKAVIERLRAAAREEMREVVRSAPSMTEARLRERLTHISAAENLAEQMEQMELADVE